MLKEAANRRIILEVKLLSFMNNEETIEQPLPLKQTTLEANPNLKTPISQEIVNSLPKTESVSGNDVKEETKENLEEKYDIDLDSKQVRINNTFAMASKLLKNMALDKWQKLDDYLTDTKYQKVATDLKDIEVGVASDKNLILVSKYPSVIDKIYEYFDLTNELIAKLFEHEYSIVVLSEEEFKQEVVNYKTHIKDKDYYIYKEEDKPLLKKKSLDNEIKIEKNKEVCYSNLVQKAIDTFGSDVVEVE